MFKMKLAVFMIILSITLSHDHRNVSLGFLKFVEKDHFYISIYLSMYLSIYLSIHLVHQPVSVSPFLKPGRAGWGIDHRCAHSGLAVADDPSEGSCSKSLCHSIKLTGWLIGIPRSWIIVIPNILASILPKLIINHAQVREKGQELGFI